jgi:hypothetical protein
VFKVCLDTCSIKDLPFRFLHSRAEWDPALASERFTLNQSATVPTWQPTDPSETFKLQIANCVGADNQRAFMLLLLYAILGCSYALGMGTWALFKMAPEVVSLARAGRDFWHGFSDGFPTAEDVIGLVFSVRVRISVRLIVVGYLTFLSVGVILAAGVLLKQQLDAVFSGETMIDSMQGAPLVSGGEVVVGRVVDDTWQGKHGSLDRVFGRGRNGRRWLWLMPRWPRKKPFSEHEKAG